jgi:hypothetical protein
MRGPGFYSQHLEEREGERERERERERDRKEEEPDLSKLLLHRRPV